MGLQHRPRELRELGMRAELRRYEAPEVVRIDVCERAELVARSTALAGGEPREHPRDTRLDLDLLALLALGVLDALEQLERFFRLAGPRQRLGDERGRHRPD